MIKEEWKDIICFSNYMISNYGKIKKGEKYIDI